MYLKEQSKTPEDKKLKLLSELFFQIAKSPQTVDLVARSTEGCTGRTLQQMVNVAYAKTLYKMAEVQRKIGQPVEIGREFQSAINELIEQEHRSGSLSERIIYFLDPRIMVAKIRYFLFH